MNRMADQESPVVHTPLLPAAGLLSFPARPLPVGSSAETVLSALYATWFDHLVQFAADHVPEDEAEDLVQQCFIELWNRFLMHGQEPDVPCESVLFRYLHFRIFDYRRVASRQSALIGRFSYVQGLLGIARRWMRSDAGVEAETEERALNRVTDKALKSLPPRTREIQVLYRRSGLDTPAIARLTGLAPSTVRELLGRGNRVLRDHLERAGYGPAARRAKEQKENHND